MLEKSIVSLLLFFNRWLQFRHREFQTPPSVEMVGIQICSVGAGQLYDVYWPVACEEREVYTKYRGRRWRVKKLCMKQVPLKVSVLLGCSTVSLGDLCRTFRDCARLSARVKVSTGRNCTTVLSTKNLHIAGKLHVGMWGYKLLEHCPPFHSCSPDGWVATV